jgi:hypothetical protein
MSEQDDAIADLKSNGVLAGMAWAWGSARRQTLQSFDPDTGHDKGWVGYNAFKVLTDRLDRIFALGKFAIQPDMDPAVGLDVLAQGLAHGEFERMPHLEPGVAIRDDLNQSPGWISGGWRILLQSYGGLDIDRIPWPQKSWTKQKVASQPTPDQQMLPPEILELPMAADVLAELSAQPPSDRTIVTLVGAYAIDAVTGESAFYIGHPRLNHRGGDAWHWRVLLDTDGHNGIGRGLPTSSPGDSPADTVADAPIRLRQPTEEKTDSQGSE